MLHDKCSSGDSISFAAVDREHIGVRANIHLGGQTEFWPNGPEQMFCLLPK